MEILRCCNLTVLPQNDKQVNTDFTIANFKSLKDLKIAFQATIGKHRAATTINIALLPPLSGDFSMPQVFRALVQQLSRCSRSDLKVVFIRWILRRDYLPLCSKST